MKEMKDLVVGVFRGGIAAEREVSLESGSAVLNALKHKGYNPVDCVIDSDKKEYIKEIIENNQIDLVFIVLHGEFGEDGQLQAILDDLGVKYTGSGPKSSYDAMDKIKTHEILHKNSIPMPEYNVFCKDTIDNALDLVKFPCVVKPHYAGSSIGVRIVRNLSEWDEAVKAALDISDKLLVEEFISGREFTVGIIGNNVLPVVEIKAKSGFYDYKSKYEDENTGFVVPAQLDIQLSNKLQDLALETFKTLGCRGVARVDILLDNKAKPYVLELNSIPGMTSHSLLPLAALKNGLSFDDLCEKIVKLSI